MSHKVQLVVPTLNAGPLWSSFITAVKMQTLFELRVLVIDSGSADQTVELAQAAGFEVKSISKSSFNHGGTRQWALEHLNEDIEFVVFMTQDAILEDEHSLNTLLEGFEEPSISGVYGRQLPHTNASWYAASLRWINYPEKSEKRSLLDKERLGIKTAFFSNSFAAYRLQSLKAVGGFPRNVILGEDMYVCAKMLLAGHKVTYCAKACVFHSHNFSYREEFKRYFDTGRFHANQPWLLEAFGSVSGEGRNTLMIQIRQSFKLNFTEGLFAFNEVLIRSFIKLSGYYFGKFLS